MNPTPKVLTVFLVVLLHVKGTFSLYLLLIVFDNAIDLQQNYLLMIASSSRNKGTIWFALIIPTMYSNFKS